MQSDRMRCKQKTKAGEPCQGYTLADGFCFSHSPALEEKRKSARAKGGRNSARAARLRRLVPPRLTAVYDRLEQALEEVYNGDLATKQATAMAALARAMVAVITAGELEERVRGLEDRIGGHNDSRKTS